MLAIGDGKGRESTARGLRPTFGLNNKTQSACNMAVVCIVCLSRPAQNDCAIKHEKGRWNAHDAEMRAEWRKGGSGPKCARIAGIDERSNLICRAAICPRKKKVCDASALTPPLLCSRAATSKAEHPSKHSETPHRESTCRFSGTPTLHHTPTKLFSCPVAFCSFELSLFVATRSANQRDKLTD
jgi:hypothetical protein